MISKISSGDMNAASRRISANKLNKTDAALKEGAEGFSDKLNKAVQNKKVDTIELSKKTITPSLTQIRDSITADISKEKDPDAVQKIRDQLESGQYFVNSHDLANFLLSTNND